MMRSMVSRGPRIPLEVRRSEAREPGPGEVRLKVLACGVCRTDLHVVDGDLPQKLACVTPGHEIVGRVEAVGEGVGRLSIGDRVGVGWLASACGRCPYCLAGRENLCDDPQFTGWTVDGGFAEQALARADYCYPIPDAYADAEAAPLLCAGLIGYRAWRIACGGAPVTRLGLYGFGAAAHLLAQLAIARGQTVYAFTRSGDAAARTLALDLGCVWAGGSETPPPEPLDAAILFAPVGALVPTALAAVRKGGHVVCAGIHMSDIPAFPYALLWGERRISSVANLTRADAAAYLPLAAEAGVRAHVTTYPLEQANQALSALRDGDLTGAAVLVP
jgi:alcohol dehydrogenase, propanol-preferring